MATNTSGRVRKANWGDSEITLLVEQCSDNIEIINGNHGEIKQSDKAEYWRKVTERINSVGTGGRTVEEVKYKWKHLKSDTKRKEQQRRREMKKTGGGGAVSTLKEWEERIITIIPTVSVEGLEDGEDVFLEKTNGVETHTMAEEEIELIVEPEFIIEKKKTVGPNKSKILKRSLEECQCEFYLSNIALNKKKMVESDQRMKLMATQEQFFRVATQKLQGKEDSSLMDIFNMITEQ